MTQDINFTLNGAAVSVSASTHTMLVDLLRETLGLTGTKVSCREGECGACTVLLDGKPVNSCLVPACGADGHEVVTIEGLRDDPLAQKVMRALAGFGASQCGYCTPGMVMMGVSILRRGKCRTAEEVRRAIEGTLCRCTGYQKIVDAILWCIQTEQNENLQ